jgi:cytosine/adenosine deaminase-related metal-dependent hydrolase
MGDDIRKDIRISNGKIQRISEHSVMNTDEPAINLEGSLVFPGLINSHDHLDFNCFPALGHRVYPNYREWGHDIQHNDKSIIEKVLNIPEKLRTQWGIYKNLMNGVTTVVNHGKRLEIEQDLIQVFQESHSYHSVGFEKNWKWKINRPQKKRWPLVLHNGEGTDDTASAEINELLRWNIFKKEIIAVHGTMMDRRQAKNFKALVWCPASNQFLFRKTAAIRELKHSTNIVFGTDSTLTASWNLWEQLRLARNEHALTDQELFESITSTAAEVWKLQDRGKVKESYQADLVVAKAKSFDQFYQLNPEDIILVICKGKIVLFDETVLYSLVSANFQHSGFEKIVTNNSCKYVAGDLSGLINNTLKYYPHHFFPFKVEADLLSNVL